ncbi:hypothetical protein PCANC_06150 [Puccinia coronata f. sp. avenae]|uniref:Uncharacterized protein n=1 Tax=Puccinia coronata f. sp. avenae TaxID=200324 RepID=A0A2N5VTK6_9BASI|nr:hypothetical protein PCANC_25827 [Puccinia coronata f. sp. avenae]PLW08784.1 hypothetical protein PCASD_23071 [Puccinia coronata f. sp. avenae]PLW46006.1 hypothetical protein PCASD_03470 [Puccinia coronata f. sp. avenae]PLW53320.1 hypothetical protein PCANC_06150 [Puccinia coronata f. sp. avenae]
MLVNSLQAVLLLCSDLQSLISASALTPGGMPRNGAYQGDSGNSWNSMDTKRNANECGLGCDHVSSSVSAITVGSAPTSAGDKVQVTPSGPSAPVDAKSLLQGWSSLIAELVRCRTTLEENAPLDAAIQATTSLVSAVQLVNSVYGRCACDKISAGDDMITEFRTLLVQFFLGVQFILSACRKNYLEIWDSVFKPIFHQCEPALTSLQEISASLQIDLGAVLTQVGVDPSVFSTADLTISSLLSIDLGRAIDSLFESFNTKGSQKP